MSKGWFTFLMKKKDMKMKKKETLLIPFKTGVDFNLDYKE